MALTHYQAKRDFRLTREPRGRVGLKKASGLGYLIQKHAASHLHYDFRLELNGVLLSWAVPKGPSLDPAVKRLAMHVEDHPLEYGGFEGTIPKGQYGGGTVMLWDRGTWSPLGDPVEGFEKGHLKFDLEGQKLHGRWALVKTRGSKYGGKGEAWLLIKDTDRFARRGAAAQVIDQLPNSVLSKRTIEQIAAAGDHEWHSDRAPQQSVGKSLALPSELSPMLATLVKTAPVGDDWLHEVKYDGYRMVSRLENGKVRIFSRNGKDWTSALGEIAAQIKKLKAKAAWLDGEVCALDRQGRSDFQTLQNALSEGAGADLVYFIFDLIHLDGRDLRGEALEIRKHLLKDLLERSATRLQYSTDVRGSGAAVFKQSCPAGLEGIVSKRVDSPYRSGTRSRDWLKVKCIRRQEMVVGGFTDPQGGRQGFGALLLGVYEGGKLRYSGKVGTGFDDRLLKQMGAKLKKLEQARPPFFNPPRGFEARGAHWVEPRLVVEVQFTEWSTAGALRHPSFIGVREDKKATEVVREKAVPVEDPKVRVRKGSRKSTREMDSGSSEDSVAGVTLSHPDKLLFPEAGVSKLLLARYYESVADWILPLLKDRPLSLFRCPDGWNKQCFYQKHADKSVHESVTRVLVPEGSGKATYFAANSLPALVALAQWGVIELHPWGSRMPKPEKPDRLIFDFDPDEAVSWNELVDGVEALRKLLQQLGLEGFLKTTGGKGLHVVVPIRTALSWDQAKAFTKAIAEIFATTFPDRFLATVSKAKRKGKTFIDYLRNAEGSTAIAAYGVRARKNAPVSTPIGWNELGRDVRFDYFNVKTVPERLRKLTEDPWKNFPLTRQTVTAAMLRKVAQ